MLSLIQTRAPRNRQREIEKLAITNDELARAMEEDGRIYGFKAADVFPIRRTNITFLPDDIEGQLGT